MTQVQGPLTVSRVRGGQVRGGTAVDDGVRSQVGELGQGCHQGRSVCGQESNETLTLGAISSRYLRAGALPSAQQAQQAPTPKFMAEDKEG